MQEPGMQIFPINTFISDIPYSNKYETNSWTWKTFGFSSSMLSVCVTDNN